MFKHKLRRNYLWFTLKRARSRLKLRERERERERE